jgi:putative ubiquitin-RnfH superfamily antitoxin RatB of RatAB toxin-antitoxin module
MGQPSAILGTTSDVVIAWVEADQGCVAKLRITAKQGAVSFADVLADPTVRALTARLSLTAWSVFGRKRLASDPVLPGDRVELLPGLRVEPKLARLRRLAKRVPSR